MYTYGFCSCTIGYFNSENVIIEFSSHTFLILKSCLFLILPLLLCTPIFLSFHFTSLSLFTRYLPQYLWFGDTVVNAVKELVMREFLVGLVHKFDHLLVMLKWVLWGLPATIEEKWCWLLVECLIRDTIHVEWRDENGSHRKVMAVLAVEAWRGSLFFLVVLTTFMAEHTTRLLKNYRCTIMPMNALTYKLRT